MLLALAGVNVALAQHRARVNYEYRLIDPVPVATGGRVEVIEFFWYGCPYCYQLQPELERWLARKPPDVVLRRIPAIFRESWVPHARLYYTLEAVGALDRLHQRVYRDVHEENQRLNTAALAAEWAVRHGIDRERWMSAYASPDVDAKIEQSVEYTKLYMVQGTPSLVVDGRYITSSAMSESMSGVIAILDDLIGVARERRAGK
jgi:thiol:disulfide interchange protein DsbA